MTAGSHQVEPEESDDRLAELHPLPLRTKAIALVLGWLLILVGLAGLVLPVFQGVLSLLLGAAVLSLVSETMLRWLRRAMRRWPESWRRMLRLRRRVHGWLRRF